MSSQVFVGRNEYIAKCVTLMKELPSSSLSESPKFITLIGPGGIGKTKVATQLGKIATEMNLLTTSTIDLQMTVNRSELSLLNSIARSLSQDTFSAFFDQLDRYNLATDLDKRIQYEFAVHSFLEGCRSLSEKSPLLLLLDTFETIQSTKLADWILKLLYQLGGRCGIVLAGRLPISLTGVKHLKLDLEPLLEEDAELLAKALYASRKVEYDLDSTSLRAIHRLGRGQPIMLTLAIEWILENAHPEEITSIPIEKFEREMVAHIRMLKQPEYLAVLLAAVASRRFNPLIMSLLSGYDIDHCTSICAELERFSFVKTGIVSTSMFTKGKTTTLKKGDLFTLHDEMIRLITQYIDFPSAFKNEKRKVLVTQYYEKEISQVADPLYRQSLLAEKIYYQLFYEPSEGMNVFNTEMQAAVEAYDFDYCNLQIGEVEKHNLDSNLRKILDLNRAEMLLKQYAPLDAKTIFNGLLDKFIPDTETELYCRVLEGLGSSIISPCTLVGADPFEALELFEKSLTLCEESKLDHRIPMVLFQLGNTYGAIGQYDRADKVYSQSLEMCKRQENLKLAARVLDEMGRLYRLQQNVKKAFGPIQESLSIRQSNNDTKNMGISFYYLGNTYRDMDNFETASQYYDKAEASFKEIRDEFNLCRLYLDIAWTAFLKGQDETAREYNEKSQELALRGNFGGEYSEYWHIAYEIAISHNETESAYDYLDKALDYAKRYNNLYMILDCLNHAVQRAYARKEFDKIPEIIKEMIDIEGRGCGILAFRGRAQMVNGDAYYDRQNYQDALEQWTNGLATIALYGNSRTNIELFGDILGHRKTKLETTLSVMGVEAATNLKNHWIKHELQYDFPVVIEICESVISKLNQGTSSSI